MDRNCNCPLAGGSPTECNKLKHHRPDGMCLCDCHKLSPVDESIRHLHDLDKVNTDAVDPTTSKAFSDKLYHLSHLDSLIAQRQSLVDRLDSLDRMHNRIASYLREYYTAEIAAGLHSGKTLEEVVIGYLSVERKRSRTWISRIRRALKEAL